MEGTRALAVVIAVLTGSFGWAAAQEVIGEQAVAPHSKSIVDIAGVGIIDLDSLPPDLRASIRLPGVAYDEPEVEYEALPPSPSVNADPDPKGTDVVPSDGEITGIGEGLQKEIAAAAKEIAASTVEREAVREGRDSPYPEREEASPDRVEEQRFTAPEDVYIRALEHIQRMQSGPVLEAPVPEPQSWLSGPKGWLASLWLPWLSAPALGQAAQCTNAAVWLPIGPAGYNRVDFAGYQGAGKTTYVTIDRSTPPPTPARIFVGTQNGGLWRSTNAGVSWVTTTDNQSWPNKTSLQIEAIAVHPTNGSLVFAGTGPSFVGYSADGSDLNKSVGTYRSTDGGDHWSQIGPTWCTTSDTACRTGTLCTKSAASTCPGTDPTNSSINIKEVVVDNTNPTTVVWAATSKGLWNSVNAATSTTPPSSIVWNLVAPATTCSDPSKCLPVVDSSTPENFNHVIVNQLYGFAIYASVSGSSIPGHNGWYRSGLRGLASTWAKINGTPPNTLPNDPVIQRAAFVPSADGSSDTIYVVVNNVPSPKCGVGGTATRIYRTTDSGANWFLLDFAGATCYGGTLCDADCTDGPTSIAADPTVAGTILFGGKSLWRVTNAGAPGQVVKLTGEAVVHVDHAALMFDPWNHLAVYDGNDGGVSRGDFGTSPEVWTSLSANLANLEFWSGALDRLNYGASYGGLQDNGEQKGGSPPLWTYSVLADGGDTHIVDPGDSNVIYSANVYGDILKSVDGGATVSWKHSGLPADSPVTALAMDPMDSKTLVTFASQSDRRIYRTTTAAEQPNPLTPAWVPISLQFPSTYAVTSFAIAPAPPSNLMFAGMNISGCWRSTTNPPSWSRVDDQLQLPSRPLRSLIIDTSQPCNAASCTLYAAVKGFDDLVPGHIFRTTDAGVHWTNIGGCDLTTHKCPGGASCLSTPCAAGDGIPNIPAEDVVLHPICNNAVYVATQMGVFRGTLNNGQCGTVNNQTWTWCAFTNGFPQTAPVKSLGVDPGSGTLRAFTYGRSVWDAQAFPAANPDQIANGTVAPATNAVGPRISGSNIGSQYSIAWLDDRPAANNWHVYYRGYSYDATGKPTPLGNDFKVDDNSLHVAQGVSVSHHRFASNPYTIAKVAWADNRWDYNYNINHIFFNHVQSDGWKMFSIDRQADQAAANSTAISPSIVYQQNEDIAVAWQQDYDVYARFFRGDGGAKANACRVTATSWPATFLQPAAASDNASNVFIAWLEANTSAAKIMLAKYAGDGSCILGSGNSCGASGGACPVGAPALQVSDASAGVSRNQPAIAVDDSGNMIVTWWEKIGSGPSMVVAKRCNNALDPASCVFVDAQCNMRCTGGTNDNLPCVSPADCAGTGAQCTSRKCVGGSNDYKACSSDANCPGGRCGAVPVACPPRGPVGAQRNAIPTVTTDDSGSVLIGWQGNPNDWNSSPAWSGMGRRFDSALATAKKDFRIDLANRSTVSEPGVARARKECVGGNNQGKLCTSDAGCPSSICRSSGKFPVVWRDNRAGHYDVYTRLVSAVP